MRQRLGITDPFGPYQRLMQHRSANTANTPGKPELAMLWLAEIDA